MLEDAAAAKLLQSCPTLCDPIDGSPPGFSIPGILQARTLEWVATSFSNAWKWKVKVKSLSLFQPLVTAMDCSLRPWDFLGKSTGVPLPSPFGGWGFLNIMCVEVVFWYLFLFWLSWMCGLVSIIKFGSFSAIITSNIPSYCGMPVMCILYLLTLFHRFWMLLVWVFFPSFWISFWEVYIDLSSSSLMLSSDLSSLLMNLS